LIGLRKNGTHPFEEIDYYFWKEWQESTFRSLHVEKEKELTKRKLENAPS